ncbi:MAG TPA: cytochrome c [Methyloversatilis sp.]
MNNTLSCMLAISAFLFCACSKTPDSGAGTPGLLPDGRPPATVTSATQASPHTAGTGDIIKGWKVWRSAACERCHGPAQEGMVGPSLIAALGRLSKDEFVKTVLEGRLDRGMPSHPYLADRIDDLYAYLKGRSDGSIAKVRPDGA